MKKLGQHKIKVLNLIMREVLELQEPYKFRVKFGIKSGSKNFNIKYKWQEVYNHGIEKTG